MTNEKTKSRRSLILLLSVFIIPVVLAKLALTNQWFNEGVTNQGTLVEGELTLANIGIAVPENKQWLVIYSVPENCDEKCIQALKGIENTYLALGRETPRVTPVALTRSPFNAEQLQSLDNNHWQFKTTNAEALKQLPPGQIYVSDPLGNIMLNYQQPQNAEDIPAFGRGMLSDMKKLLKYSRIG